MSTESEPGQDKKEPIKLEEAKPDAVAPGAAPAKPDPFCKADFGKDGILRVEVNVLAAVSDFDKFYIMRGWLDGIRDEAIMRVLAVRKQIADEKQKLILQENKNGQRKFLNGLFRR